MTNQSDIIFKKYFWCSWFCEFTVTVLIESLSFLNKGFTVETQIYHLTSLCFYLLDAKFEGS